MNESNISFHHGIARSFCKHDLSDTDIEHSAKAIAFILVSTFSVISNTFIIVLAIKYTESRGLHHLIINMAVSDILYTLVRILTSTRWLSKNKWSLYSDGIFSQILCKLVAFIVYVSAAESLITLLVISVERFKATKSVLRRDPRTLRQRVIVLLCCWLFPILGYAYLLYSANIIRGRQGVNICAQFQPSSEEIAYSLLMSANISILVVCVIILVLSYLTTRQLFKPLVIQAHLNEDQRKARERRTRSAVRMVMVSVLLYMFCWLPLKISFCVNFLTNGALHRRMRSLCLDVRSMHFVTQRFLPLLNSCLSPWILVAFLGDFRQAAKEIFKH